MADVYATRGLRFNNKVAVVSGGCKGIGRACVDVFVEHGGKVAVLDIDDTIGSQMVSDGPGEIFFIRCDCTKEEDVKNSIALAVEKYGQIDCLVNNVGTHPGSFFIEEITVEDFRRLVDINLHLRRVKGTVVSLASYSGMFGQEKSSVYCATKCESPVACGDWCVRGLVDLPVFKERVAAITGMTKALAIDEAKYGVRVNTIAPGPIHTPLFDEWSKTVSPDNVDQIKDWTVMRRLGHPREIGKACLYLATDATYCTGAELVCSGGADIGYGTAINRKWF